MFFQSGKDNTDLGIPFCIYNLINEEYPCYQHFIENFSSLI